MAEHLISEDGKFEKSGIMEKENESRAEEQKNNITEEPQEQESDTANQPDQSEARKRQKNKKSKKSHPAEEFGLKLAEISEKYIRLSAEFDNYRKRTLKEKIDLTKTANENLLTNILPLIDDYDRAMQSIDNSTDIDAVKQGIHLIHNKFTDFIAQNGVREITARDCDFNTDLHEAVTKFPVDSDEKKGKVIDVLQKGYTLNDKVIRYAKVVVGE